MIRPGKRRSTACREAEPIWPATGCRTFSHRLIPDGTANTDMTARTETDAGDQSHHPTTGTKKPQALRERLAVFRGCDNPVHGAPGGIRTPDQWLRKPLLYPAELRAHLELAITDVAVLTAAPATGRTGIVPNTCRHAYWFLPFPAEAPRKRSEPPPGCAGITSSAP